MSAARSALSAIGASEISPARKGWDTSKKSPIAVGAFLCAALSQQVLEFFQRRRGALRLLQQLRPRGARNLRNCRLLSLAAMF